MGGALQPAMCQIVLSILFQALDNETIYGLRWKVATVIMRHLKV